MMRGAWDFEWWEPWIKKIPAIQLLWRTALANQECAKHYARHWCENWDRIWCYAVPRRTQSLGYLKKMEIKRSWVYGIKGYKDFVPLFGENGHIWIKNKQLDFCYVSLETVKFYLRRWAPVQELTMSGDTITSTHGGHVLTFKFVCMDGVRRHLDSVHHLK